MKVLAFSDLHRSVPAARALVKAARKADLVIGAGDFASFGRGLADTLDVLADLAVPFVLVAGNHERVDHLKLAAQPHAHWHVLHGQSVMIDGRVVFGLGYAIEPANISALPTILTDAEAAPLLGKCPFGAILVTHAPPLGIADRDHDGGQRGSAAVRCAIEGRKPSLHLCGHIHAGWGTTGDIGARRSHNLGPTVNWFDL